MIPLEFLGAKEKGGGFLVDWIKRTYVRNVQCVLGTSMAGKIRGDIRLGSQTQQPLPGLSRGR